MKRERRTIFLVVVVGILALIVSIVFLLVVNSNQSGGQQQRYTDLLNRLQNEGVTVQSSNTLIGASEHCFSISRRAALLNGEEIWVFDYSSSLSANIASSQIYPDGYGVSILSGSCAIDWIAPPHFFKNGNLIVLYVGNQTQILKALRAVFGSQFAGT